MISSSPYTIENLNKYPKGLTTIINLNKIEPMMCKPVLFDVAFNYISYDSTKQTTTNTATTTPVETSSPDVDETIDNENSKNGDSLVYLDVVRISNICIYIFKST